MPTESALGLCIAGVWFGRLDRSMDRRRFFGTLFRLCHDFAGLWNSSKKVGIALSLREYNAIEYGTRSDFFGVTV